MNEQVYNGINNSMAAESVLQSLNDLEQLELSPRSDAGSPKLQRRISLALLKSYEEDRNDQNHAQDRRDSILSNDQIDFDENNDLLRSSSGSNNHRSNKNSFSSNASQRKKDS